MALQVADTARVANNKRGKGTGRGQREMLRPNTMTEDTGPGHSSGLQSSPVSPRLIEGLPADLHEGAFDPFMDEDELEEMHFLVDTMSKRRVAPTAPTGSMDIILAPPQAPEKHTLYKLEVCP